MIKKSILKRSIFIIIALIWCIMARLFFKDLSYAKYILFITILIQIYGLFKFRYDNIFLIFNIFTISYYKILIDGYYFGNQLTPHIQNFSNGTDEKTVIIYCIFYLAMFITFYKSKKVSNKNMIEYFKCKDNYGIYWFCVGMIIIFTILGHSSYNFGEGYNKSSTIFNEYIIVWLFLSLSYANTTCKKNIIVILFIINSLINFLLGDRIAVLQNSIIIFLMRYNKKFDYKRIVIAVLFVYLIFNIVDGARATGEYKINIKSNTSKSEIINNNQSQVFNSAVTIVKLVDNKIVTGRDRAVSFMEFILRIGIPKNRLSDLSELSGYARNYYLNQGGGFIAAYYYFWGGWIGVILIGAIVGMIISSLDKNTVISFKVFSIMIIAMMPRWLAYDPIQMIKVPLITVIIYIIFYLFNNKKLVFIKK